MILAIECVAGCALFGAFIMLSVLKNQKAWINEYPEAVQKRYIELHPESEIKEPEQNLLCRELCIVTAYGLW